MIERQDLTTITETNTSALSAAAATNTAFTVYSTTFDGLNEPTTT